MLDQAENDFIKGVLMAINPKEGTDYRLSAMDADHDRNIHWMSGKPFTFSDRKSEAEPAAKTQLHMNYDNDFKWDTKKSTNEYLL